MLPGEPLNKSLARDADHSTSPQASIFRGLADSLTCRWLRVNAHYPIAKEDL
jgi:hypothetical protein